MNSLPPVPLPAGIPALRELYARLPCESCAPKNESITIVLEVEDGIWIDWRTFL